MSEFVTLGAHVAIQKGKAPLATGDVGRGAEPYLNPEYLRGRASVELAKAGPDAVRAADGDTILLWDGSNAGEFFRAREGVVASTMAKISPGPAFFSGYFFHVVKHAERYLKSQTNGTGIPHVDRELLEGIKVFRPEAQCQQKIGTVLDTLDTAIHETEAIIAKLKAVKHGLLPDLLTRGIDANGELRPPQAEAPHFYKPSPLGWIPHEWDCVRLSEKLAVFGGKRLPVGHSYADHSTAFKYLRVTDFFERDYSLDDLENLHERTFRALDRYEIRSGQLFISIAGSLGYVGVHQAERDVAIRTILTENAARLVPLCALEPEFVAAYMNSNMVQAQVTAEKGTGGGVPKLALFRIEQFRLAWPGQDEQVLIAEHLRGISERISDEAALLRKLRLEKVGLMDELLTGRVRVTPLLTAEKQGSA
jgi:type I restriction enzyme S subunit